MLKISNETKVGVLTAVGITLLVLGFNLLKGKSLFSNKKIIYAVYTQVNGLQPANTVEVNGLVVGSVLNLDVMDKNAGRILVTLQINKKIEIPKNSVARISSDLLGTKKVQVDFGNANDYLKSGDTLYAAVDGSISDALKEQLNPLVAKLQVTLSNVDSVLLAVNGIFDPATKGNLREAINSLNATMHNLNNASGSVDRLLASNGSVSTTLNNLSSFSTNLNNNNDKINAVLANAEKATASLANGDIDKSLDQLKQTVTNLNSFMSKLNSKDGTLGLLMNDKAVYNNLQNTLSNLNKLMEDLRYNPNRYVHLSLFGKKNKVLPIPSDSAK
ncbi:phospholipid/cholesterol/gamma-HCH transport system substrate-binding protein [Chitinophaga skermanii]|uniref:Phospholipid/cholesterol/gamma-HCH transport system substrate-binding protein n=1 Tax=Chitinophaga skermanii TaxID=331697 RepID=A0A327QFB4_9BACT|nr:MlaD family protein [Chitinophaga skermanii]RAJ00367.1 phospholipid/cholesterol/gamma-HCH transport system substrate-binding protein [Chitinophaga skermanii]